jgi:glucosamine-6-phosphate deaminase
VAAIFQPEIMVAADNVFGRQAASVVMARLEGVSRPLIVLPTGHTPLAMYEALVDGYADHPVWKRTRCLTLDDYAGLAPGDARLFQGWLARVFWDKMHIPQENRICFNSTAMDAAAEAARVDGWITQNGPIDVAVLGLGLNGHIGFNEPGSPFHSPTRRVALTHSSIKANAAYWGGEDRVPRHAFTLGLGTLGRAQHIVLLVNGTHKAAILDKVLNGPVTPDIPATVLRTLPHVTIIADRAAMG